MERALRIWGRTKQRVPSELGFPFNFKDPLRKVSYEQIPLVRGRPETGCSNAQFKGFFTSDSATRKIMRGPSVKDWRGGRLASFSSIPDSPKVSEFTENVQSSLNGEAIENETNEMFSSEPNSSEFVGNSNSITFDRNDRLKKSAIPLFPSIGSNLLYLRDGAGLSNNLFLEDARANYIAQLRKKCFNLMGKSDKLMALVEKCIAQDGPGALTKELEMLTEIILRSNRVPYGCNSYLNEVKKMRSLASNSTNTKTSVETIKLRSVYQSASMIAQDICSQLRSKTQFRVIFGKIIREIPIEMKNGVEGIHVAISGRINGAEIARTECGKYGKTSRTTISQKVDYACAEALTRSGLIGVKVWISYRKSRNSHSSKSVEA